MGGEDDRGMNTKALRIGFSALLMSLFIGLATESAQADEWDMAICVYESTWIPQCSQPWTVATPPRVYKVRRHDTLWRIAVRMYGDGNRWREIARVNHIKGTTIRVGQRLIIPSHEKDH